MSRICSKPSWRPLLVAILGLLSAAAAQNSSAVVTVKPATLHLRERRVATLSVQLQVRDGYHINSNRPKLDYLIATQFTLAPPPGFTLVGVKWPVAVEKKFAFSADPLAVFQGTVALGVQVKAGRHTAGAHVLHGTLRYQACSEELCRPPVTIPVDLQVDVVHG